MLSEALARVNPARRAFFGGQAALALAEAGLADDARVKIAEHVERWPDDVQTRMLAGDALAFVGDAEAALAQYQAALLLARGGRGLPGNPLALQKDLPAHPSWQRSACGAAPPAALQTGQIAAERQALTGGPTVSRFTDPDRPSATARAPAL